MIYEIHTLVSRREKFWTQFFFSPCTQWKAHVFTFCYTLHCCAVGVCLFLRSRIPVMLSRVKKNLISKRNNFKTALDAPARFSRELFRSFSTLWWGKTGNVLINKISFPAGRQRAAEVDNIGCDGWMAGMFEKLLPRGSRKGSSWWMPPLVVIKKGDKS